MVISLFRLHSFGEFSSIKTNLRENVFWVTLIKTTQTFPSNNSGIGILLNTGFIFYILFLIVLLY